MGGLFLLAGCSFRGVRTPPSFKYNIRMRRTITEQDKRILDRYSDQLIPLMPGAKRLRANLFKAGYTQVNGGTVVIDNSGNPPEYIEDDLFDGQRRPYKILLPNTHMPLPSGSRLIVIINGDNIYLLKREKELESLVPEEGPQQPYNDSPHIGHQNQLKYTDLTVTDSDIRIKNFFKNYRNNERHRKDAILFGAGFFGLLGWIFIVFAAYGYIFRFTPLGDGYFAVGLPLILIMTIVTIVVADIMYSKKLRGKYKDLKSVTKVILVHTIHVYGNPYIRDFVVCEKNSSGDYVARSYVGTSMFDESDASRMKPGQIIYKYTYGNNEAFLGTK